MSMRYYVFQHHGRPRATYFGPISCYLDRQQDWKHSDLLIMEPWREGFQFFSLSEGCNVANKGIPTLPLLTFLLRNKVHSFRIFATIRTEEKFQTNGFVCLGIGWRLFHGVCERLQGWNQSGRWTYWEEEKSGSVVERERARL